MPHIVSRESSPVSTSSSVDRVTCYNGAFKNWPRIARTSSKVVAGILPGEGVGPELMAICQNILKRVGAYAGQEFEFHTGGLIGIPAWKESGEWVTEEVESFCREIHAQKGAILCGPGGGRFVYELRSQLDLFCKLVPLQPTLALNGVGPLRPEAVKGVDILVVRENMGGLYQGEHAYDEDEGSLRVRHCFSYAQPQVERILRVGVKLAQLRRSKLCVIHKPGGIPAISELWKKLAIAVCEGTDVELEMLEIDNAIYQIIADAARFDVVVAPNMFGDVLADGITVLLGSRGMSLSANFSDDGMGVYQTGHGAAYDLAGRDRANPIGQINSMVFMLRLHYNLEKLANAIEQGVEDVLTNGWRTADIMESDSREVGSQQMGELIAEAACARLDRG